jgi:heme-degrading monooxygenase HmoA
MRRRCGNDPHYVARGIAVCSEWDSYEAFANWARVAGWREGLTIDRIDNARGYEPLNCRFATKAEQARNRTSTRFTADQVRAIRADLAGWKKGDLSEYARRHGLHPRYLHQIVTLKRWADI